jgi:CubicO group peptidase (beta-lactamase class C family)
VKKYLSNALFFALLLLAVFPRSPVFAQTAQSYSPVTQCHESTLLTKIETIFSSPIYETALTQSDGTRIRLKSKFLGTVLVARNGKIIFEKSYGNADSQNLNRALSRFEIGSITKQFTAAAILKLQEMGKLSVKDPIAKYLPGVPQNDWQNVTIEKLLTHRAGIWDGDSGPSQISLLQYADIIFQSPLHVQTGYEGTYSNLGYVLLAAIIESVSGKPYERFLHETIFQTVGMLNTGVLNGTDPVEHLSQPHIMSQTVVSGRYVNRYYFEEIKPRDKSFMHGAGDMYSTAGDLLKWHLALIGGRILNLESVNEMEHPRSEVDGESYGFGLTIQKLGSQFIIGHGGSTIGSKARIESSINGKTTVIILANADFYTYVRLASQSIWVAVKKECLL